MNRNHYTAEFKAKAILELLREEKTLSQIAADYGVPDKSLEGGVFRENIMNPKNWTHEETK